MGLFSRNKDVFSEFDRQEKELIKIYKDLPGDWLLHDDILQLIEKIEDSIEKNEKKLKESEFGRLETKVNKRVEELIKRIERHLFLLKQHLVKVKSNKVKKNLTPTIKQSMQILADDLHKLVFYANLYPIHNIQRRKFWKGILKGLNDGTFLPPDISYEKASELVNNFVNEKLVVVVQYNSNERPYLMITLDGKKPVFHIIKSGDPGTSLIISKLMRLLGMKHMIIDYKRKFIDDKVEHLNKINFFEGMKFIDMGRVRNVDEVMSLAYYLGAACADGFVMNLDDRPGNIYIDYTYFEKIKKRRIRERYLSSSNPIFHIDYDFVDIKDMRLYLESQIFGVYGIFVHFIMGNVDMTNSRLRIPFILGFFNLGFQQEMQRIRDYYNSNKQQVDSLLVNNKLGYIKKRLDPQVFRLLLDVESEYIPKIKL